MLIITGEWRSGARFITPGTGGFPLVGPTVYEMGMQFLARTAGTDDDQVDRVYAHRYTFVASTPQEIDVFTLIGGPRIRWAGGKIVSGNDAALAGLDEPDEDSLLILGGSESYAWEPIGGIPVYPGTTLNHGGFILSAPKKGIPLSSESKMLLMTPNAFAFSFDLFLLGASE